MTEGFTYLKSQNCFGPQNAGTPAHKMQVRQNVNLQLLPAGRKSKLVVAVFRTVPWLNLYLVLQT